MLSIFQSHCARIHFLVGLGFETRGARVAEHRCFHYTHVALSPPVFYVSIISNIGEANSIQSTDNAHPKQLLAEKAPSKLPYFAQ